ncbi:hypothetical protein M422DRAFT_153016, partial [Sphaerobolus stellatus SS14]
GELRCKRHCPWPLSDKDYVSSDGQWFPRCTCPRLNTWCCPIMFATRAKHDIKILTNGADTHDVSWYTIKYAAKQAEKSYNVSALLARRLAYQKKNQVLNPMHQERNHTLIVQCVNTLSKYFELSSQQIVSLLSGWGDRFESHGAISIYLSTSMYYVHKTFPEFLTDQE